MAKNKPSQSDDLTPEEPIVTDPVDAEPTAAVTEPPPAAEEPEPKEEPATEKAESREAQLPKVPLRTWLQLSGKKPDQMAGFLRHAKSLGPMTVPQWRREYESFLARPVK